MKRLLSLTALILGLFLPTAAHASSGLSLDRYAVDPYGRSVTMCGFNGAYACRRLYSNGTWDQGNWSGGFNGAYQLGWDQGYAADGTHFTWMCGGYAATPWAMVGWSNVNCVLMWDDGTFILRQVGA